MKIIQSHKGYEILAIIFDRDLNFNSKIDKIIEVTSVKNAGL